MKKWRYNKFYYIEHDFINLLNNLWKLHVNSDIKIYEHFYFQVVPGEKRRSLFTLFHDFSYQLGGLYKMLRNILISGIHE